MCSSDVLLMNPQKKQKIDDGRRSSQPLLQSVLPKLASNDNNNNLSSSCTMAAKVAQQPSEDCSEYIAEIAKLRLEIGRLSSIIDVAPNKNNANNSNEPNHNNNDIGNDKKKLKKFQHHKIYLKVNIYIKTPSK